MEREKLIALVKQAQKGSPDAMESLFEAYYNDVYYFALKTVKDSELACDITQETFLEVINTVGSLKEPAAFVTWVKQITYHQCTRYFKKKKEVLVEEDEEGNTIFDTLADESEDSIPSEVYEKEEFRNTILGIINELTEEQRSAVMMYYFDELPVGQIAQIQGVSEGTVKSRLNYARKAIKKSVESYEKKHNIKLHSFSFLPLFLLFFGKELMPAAKAAQIGAVVSDAASLAGAGAAAAGGAAAAEGTAAVAAKGVTGALVAKIAAGVTAAALVVGGGVYVANQVLHEDKNRDCICDYCGSDYHHGSVDEQTGHERGICTECGFYIGVHDENDDKLCDDCGEYFCGPSHLNMHSFVDGVCQFCGMGLTNGDTPVFESPEDYNGLGLEMLGICERTKEDFASLLGELDYVVTKDGRLLDTYEDNAEIIPQEAPQQWFAAGAYPAYYDAAGQVHILGLEKEFVCTDFAGKIVCASPYSFGAGDELFLEDIHVYTRDENGYLYWNRYITQLKQERLIGKVEPYTNRPTTLCDQDTGKVMDRVEDVAVMFPHGGNVIFLRYVADGMVYETDIWQWEFVAGETSIPVRNTGIRAEDLLSELSDTQMVCKDPANNGLLIQGQPVGLPEGRTLDQIAGVWSAPWTNVLTFEDGAVYLGGIDGDLSWQYSETLTNLNREGKIVEFMAMQIYGNVYVKMDDGLLYAIIEGTR